MRLPLLTMNNIFFFTFVLLSIFTFANNSMQGQTSVESSEEVFNIASSLEEKGGDLNERFFKITTEDNVGWKEKIWHGYNFIEGFNYEEGYRYKIRVKVTKKEMMTMQYPNTTHRYQLLEIIEKIKDDGGSGDKNDGFVEDIFEIDSTLRVVNNGQREEKYYQIKARSGNEIEPIWHGYNFIKGFNYEEGYKYVIKVNYKKKEFVAEIYPNTSYEYNFLELISKTSVDYKDKKISFNWQNVPQSWVDYSNDWQDYEINFMRGDLMYKYFFIRHKTKKQTFMWDNVYKYWIFVPNNPV